jgi:hypothetical protein
MNPTTCHEIFKSDRVFKSSQELKKKQEEEEERQRQRQIRQNQQQQDTNDPNQPGFGLWSANTQTQLGEWTLSGGMGFFPSLFGLQFQSFPTVTRRPQVPSAVLEVSRPQVQQLTQIHTITDCCLALSALGS